MCQYLSKIAYGYGQSNIWYADEDNNEKVKKFRDKICNDIESIIKNTTLGNTHDDEMKYFEGGISKSIKEVSRITRNAEARRKCLEYFFQNGENYICQICGFDFEKLYGEIGKSFIEVHHIKSHTLLSKEKGEHEIDPQNDLIPVCSNCHSIIHRKKDALEISELKRLIEKSAILASIIIYSN
jgi:predicted HNH restriction endonuclease